MTSIAQIIAELESLQQKNENIEFDDLSRRLEELPESEVDKEGIILNSLTLNSFSQIIKVFELSRCQNPKAFLNAIDRIPDKESPIEDSDLEVLLTALMENRIRDSQDSNIVTAVQEKLLEFKLTIDQIIHIIDRLPSNYDCFSQYLRNLGEDEVIDRYNLTKLVDIISENAPTGDDFLRFTTTIKEKLSSDTDLTHEDVEKLFTSYVFHQNIGQNFYVVEHILKELVIQRDFDKDIAMLEKMELIDEFYSDLGSLSKRYNLNLDQIIRLSDLIDLGNLNLSDFIDKLSENLTIDQLRQLRPKITQEEDGKEALYQLLGSISHKTDKNTFKSFVEEQGYDSETMKSTFWEIISNGDNTRKDFAVFLEENKNLIHCFFMLSEIDEKPEIVLEQLVAGHIDQEALGLMLKDKNIAETISVAIAMESVSKSNNKVMASRYEQSSLSSSSEEKPNPRVVTSSSLTSSVDDQSDSKKMKM